MGNKTRASTRPTAVVNMAARRDNAVIGNDNVPEDPAITALRARAQRIFETRGLHGVQHTLGAAALAYVVK